MVQQLQKGMLQTLWFPTKPVSVTFTSLFTPGRSGRLLGVKTHSSEGIGVEEVEVITEVDLHKQI